MLAAGTGYGGIGGSNPDRLKAISEGNEFIEEGVKTAAEDPNADRTAQCVKEHGEGFFYDPSLEMCSYKQK